MEDSLVRSIAKIHHYPYNAKILTAYATCKCTWCSQPASRSQDEIFLFTRCGDITFYQTEKECSTDSVRIITITHINLHSELASCKPWFRALCYYSQMKVRRVPDQYRFSHRAHWELTNAEMTRYVYLFQNFSRDETFSGSRGNHSSHPEQKSSRTRVARMICGSMSSIWLRV